jgi:hypothetical protein
MQNAGRSQTLEANRRMPKKKQATNGIVDGLRTSASSRVCSPLARPAQAAINANSEAIRVQPACVSGPIKSLTVPRPRLCAAGLDLCSRSGE